VSSVARSIEDHSSLINFSTAQIFFFSNIHSSYCIPRQLTKTILNNSQNSLPKNRVNSAKKLFHNCEDIGIYALSFHFGLPTKIKENVCKKDKKKKIR
jgi:hypothetical protein